MCQVRVGRQHEGRVWTVPEWCSAGVDEMREMASTIKTEVLTELNATRKRLHQIASTDVIGCNTLTSQVSSHRSTFRAKAKSHTSRRKQQRAKNDVSMAMREVLNAMKVNRTLLCEKESWTADVADLVLICTPFAEEILGIVVERHGRNVRRRPSVRKGHGGRGEVSAIPPIISVFSTWLIMPVVTCLS